MIYVDTSVLVPLFLNEPHSAAVANWYAREKANSLLRPGAFRNLPAR